MRDEIPVIDLHAHFPMHTPFPPAPFSTPAEHWKKALFNTTKALLNDEPLHGSRVTLEHWFADDARLAVKGVGSVLYDPEDEFLVDTGANPRPDAIDHLKAQLRNVEDELKADGDRVAVARNPDDVERLLKAQRRFIFHTVEGGFGLGGDPCNVRALASLGVASLTPAHLLYRGVATCEVGFPPVAAALFQDELEHQPSIGLSPLGKSIVEECFKHGVIVDITHARADAQKDIFAIADGYPHRPLISSHNSVRLISNWPLNLSTDALLRIKASGGVVGVIFYKHWLRRRQLFDTRSDFQLIADVIDCVRVVTGSHDYIAIGSDLDGFIDPIATCSNYSRMSALVDFILHRYPGDAEKILSGNVLRVLHAGWTGVRHDAHM